MRMLFIIIALVLTSVDITLLNRRNKTKTKYSVVCTLNKQTESELEHFYL